MVFSLRVRFVALTLVFSTVLLHRFAIAADAPPKPAEPKGISFYKEVRPIFQMHCQGCHQHAKPMGDYVMTAFDRLLKGGESGEPAIVPGKPDGSSLVELITPVKGKAEMPKGKQPLAATEIETIRQWIAQGAKDDTPAGAKEDIDMAHPPVYSRPPVVTSMDFSPDGSQLAVAGFHETLLVKPDGSGLIARLVGVAERIETVRFSPDGKRLLVIGGLPCRAGEVQIWDVVEKKLKLSVTYTFDTLYGGSWSPDGKLIAFGGADNSVRAINAETGEQVLFQGAHTDWVRDTTFSFDGSHVVSVGRDMTVKLTEVATQRFIDNVTSITPGVLKGGIQAVARHPKFDHIVAAGAEGTPRIYRLFREAKRVIGDDANLVMELFTTPGRVFTARFSADGKLVATGSSLDNHGEVVVCSYNYDGDVPANIKAILGKVPGQRSPQEKKTLEDHKLAGVKVLGRTTLPTGVYAVAFHPNGQSLAASGADGLVRLIDPSTGSVTKEFSAAPISIVAAKPLPVATVNAAAQQESTETESLPAGAKVKSLQVLPAAVRLSGKYDYTQLIVTAVLESGDLIDATRMSELKLSGLNAEVSRGGLVRGKVNGKGTLTVSLAGHSVAVPVEMGDTANAASIDFIRDVSPVLSRLGCNQGTCHGAAKGKNGFKLSLRGYDPIFDLASLCDDLASRRVNVASPDDSLMLLKPTGVAPHVGGVLTQPGEAYYEIIRAWIAGGAKLDLSTPRVAKIEVFPLNPTILQIGGKQQIRVLATYANGDVRDVTREAFIESGLPDVAVASRTGLMTAERRGEAAVLARYEGAYAATTLTVMGDRTGFTWQAPPVNNKIDELTAAKWQRMKIQPSDLCGDADFIRRASLDLTGLPPTADEVRGFLADKRDTRVKRDELINKLVGNDAYVDHWTNKWADLLQVNRKFLGPEGAALLRKWIREQVANNVPYDEFARQVITATGSNRENPAASYFKILRTPQNTMENTTHLFLAVRFNCNKCHDHPFEKWTQDQYYQTAAYFAQVGLAADPKGGDGKIGGTAVEGAKPLYEIVSDRKDGDVTHERTNQITPPKFPYDCKFEAKENATRREQIASWMTSPDNQYFAKSYVNRLWGYLFGVGIVEPIDDIRASNPPTNPELIDYLTREFIEHKFDTRHIVRLICQSRTYQLSLATNKWNEDDKINYSHAKARRLPAEVMVDAVYRVTGTLSKFPGVPAGTRAAALPDSGIELPGSFLTTMGRPARESSCECERSNGLQLGPVMALISGPTIAEAIADGANELTKLTAATKDDSQLVNEVFLRVLNRSATEAEIKATLEVLGRIPADHDALTKSLADHDALIKPIRAAAEKKRADDIAAATAAIAAREKEIAPQVATQEKQRQDRIKQRETELAKFEKEQLPKTLNDWELRQSAGHWIPLDPKTLTATGGVKLVRQDDLSIRATDKDGKSIYTVVAETDLKNITGIRLEALPDEKLPAGGPGNNKDGNFVLNEFEVQAGPKGKPTELAKVTLGRPLTDFTQDNFDIKQTTDNIQQGSNGWAIGGGGRGVIHWATFEVKQPLSHEAGTVLTIKLYHQFNQKDYTLGRFRISVTTAPHPIGLTLPEDLRKVLATDADKRDAKQKEALVNYFRGIDPELRSRTKALADARQPLPIDPKLKELQDRLELVNQPIPEDQVLVQLRADLEQSAKQLNDKRLTLVQDLTWALINSPAFLFNH